MGTAIAKYEKEAQEAQTITEKAVELVAAKTIRTAADFDEAKDLLGRIAAAKKEIKERKEAITSPLNEALKAARALFAPFEERIETAEAAFKGKMLDYKRKLDAELAAKQREQEQKIAAGTTTLEKAGKSIERVERKAEAIPTRKVRKMVVKDASKVPDEYWVIDEVALRRDVLSGKSVPGTEVVEEEIITNRF